ncbi:MAG TPA: electron transport complex subunit RsxE [Chitinivibrionales bacterium]
MILEEVKRGIARENPLLCLALGLCPALAITTTVLNAVGMGLTVLFVVTSSNALISIIRRWIPEKVRIPCCITVIATMVTIADLFLKAHAPILGNHLGIYVALIASNCMILHRAEKFAFKNNFGKSTIDGMVMGLKFCSALVCIAALRELFGADKVLGLTVIPGLQPMGALAMAPGGFFIVAGLIGFVNYRRSRQPKRKQ